MVKMVIWNIVKIKAAIPKTKNNRAYKFVSSSAAVFYCSVANGLPRVRRAINILAKNILKIGKITPLASARNMPVTKSGTLSLA